MKKSYLACLSLVFAANLVQASSNPCDTFEIKIKNASKDDLLVTKVRLDNATIQPNSIELLKEGMEQTFTISESSSTANMNGEFDFKSITIPVKTVKIRYELKNRGFPLPICRHNDKPQNNDYSVEKTRMPSTVLYKIG